MSCCNPGYCCVVDCANTPIPSAYHPVGSTCTPWTCKLSQGWNNFLGSTVGALWSAGTGTVDPWTKAALVCCQKNALQKASAGNIASCVANQTVSTQITNCLVKNNADPSQAACGLKNSANKFLSDIETTVVVVVVVAIIAIILMNMFTSSLVRR